MRFAIVAKDTTQLYELEKTLKARKHKLATSRLDFVICSGGDGTLLIAERQYPGVPKLQIKDSELCNTCPGYDTPIDELLHLLEEKKFSLTKYFKLDAAWKRKGRTLQTFTCTNEFSIRNQLLIQAIRFQIKIDEEIALAPEIIGDGIVISTVFGSNAYYKSITGKNFSEGTGLALNNCTLPQKGIHTTREKKIVIRLTRMHADFAIDNDTNIHTLEPGDEIEITASAQQMNIVHIEK